MSYIKPIFTPRLKGIKPILFSLKQSQGRNEFHDLETEHGLTILVPCALQFLIAMSLALEIVAVSIPANTKIYRTANVKLFVGKTNNTVDARCIRYVDREHCTK